jgi:hypothetical protein
LRGEHHPDSGPDLAERIGEVAHGRREELVGDRKQKQFFLKILYLRKILKILYFSSFLPFFSKKKTIKKDAKSVFLESNNQQTNQSVGGVEEGAEADGGEDGRPLDEAQLLVVAAHVDEHVDGQGLRK